MQALEMQPRLAALSLVLGNVGCKADIRTTEARKRLQKVIYLAQRSGVNLGYRYGWYKMGPYSPALAQDYYDLANALAVGESPNGHSLQEPQQKKLRKLQAFFEPPEGLKDKPQDWLELLASVDYLRKVLRYNNHQVAETIEKQKHALSRYLTHAKQTLERMPLIN
jgi:uncharacterized protein YwgA